MRPRSPVGPHAAKHQGADLTLALIDYDAGNLTSVRKALTALNAPFVTPSAPSDLRNHAAVIVPGVGHFGATRVLDEPWRDQILYGVEAGKPLLGICLGLQWLFEGSEEAPDVPGLGLVPGRCMRLSSANGLKVPHVGWNALDVKTAGGVLAGVADESQVYFTHSYAAPVTDACAASTTYGATFASVVQHDHICGVQFHPEKSGDVGLRILRNFLALVMPRLKPGTT
jgi:glutamine amidotransferase